MERKLAKDNNFLVLAIIVIFLAALAFIFAAQKQQEEITRQITRQGKVERITPLVSRRPPAPKIRPSPNLVKDIDEMSAEEVRERLEIIKEKSEFDLFPTAEELIEMKEKKIKSY